MTRFIDMKAYILNDVELSALATEERYEEMAEILNSKTVTKLGTVTSAWLMTFLGAEGLWLKIIKISEDPLTPDTDVIKNACAILVNYLRSGNSSPFDFGVVETISMLQGFLYTSVINQSQYDKIIAKCSYQAPFVVETWGDYLTSSDELRLIMTT